MSGVLFKMNVFECIDWIKEHQLFMTYLYALERSGKLNKRHKDGDVE